MMKILKKICTLDFSTNTMKWIGRGLAILGPAAIGFMVHEMGRCQGLVEANEEHASFLTGLLEQMENLSQEESLD